MLLLLAIAHCTFRQCIKRFTKARELHFESGASHHFQNYFCTTQSLNRL